MISSLAWVPAGVADPSPKRYEMSAVEQELLKLVEESNDPAAVEAKLLAELEEKSKRKKNANNSRPDHSLPADLRMDEYSSDEDEDGMALGNLMLGKESGLDTQVEFDSENSDDDGHDENDENPADRSKASDSDSDESRADDDLDDVPDTREYMPVNVDGLQSMGLADTSGTGGVIDEMEEDDDNSEIEDVRLTPDDALIVIGKTEEDFASLEVHVYDQKTGNLFVHHDIPLPSYPLCLAHGMVTIGGETGNFCAVGTFSPGIEIWNLDVLNALEPSCVLGGEDTSTTDIIMKLQMLGASGGTQSTAKFRKPEKAGLRLGSHKDAVMSLSWNQIHRQVLASGSADCTVKVWDVTQAGNATHEKCCALTFNHHRDKVQCVEWHPKEGTLLATGSFDRTVALLDARANGAKTKSVKLTADCEAIAWDPFHTEYLTAVSEDGTISCWDVRNFQTNKPLWTFVANEYGGVTSLAYNPQVPGMMATCSKDATVTLWNAYSQNHVPTANFHPRSIAAKDMCSGKLYALSFYPSSPWLLATGGSGNQLALWDLSAEDGIQNVFSGNYRGTREVEPSEINSDKSYNAEEVTIRPGPDGIEKSKLSNNDRSSKRNKKRRGKARKGH